jgi:hypothetical protein
VVLPGSAPEVVEIQGTKGALRGVGYGLERDLTKETEGDLLGLGTKVCMPREQTVQNGVGLVGSKPLKDRGFLGLRCLSG